MVNLCMCWLQHGQQIIPHVVRPDAVNVMHFNVRMQSLASVYFNKEWVARLFFNQPSDHRFPMSKGVYFNTVFLVFLPSVSSSAFVFPAAVSPVLLALLLLGALRFV